MTDRELKPEQLRWTCPSDLDPKTFEEVVPAEGTVGQDRAIRALQLGLEMRAPGYNIFVAGYPGTGRATTVRKLLESLTPERCPTRHDLAYVHHFAEPNHPRLLRFPVGHAAKFKVEIDRLILSLQRDVPKLLEDDRIKRERAEVDAGVREQITKVISGFEAKLKTQGFALIKVQAGGMVVPDISPLIDGKVVSMEGLPALEKEGKIVHAEAESFAKKYAPLREELEVILKKISELTKGMDDKLAEIERRAVSRVLSLKLSDLRSRYPAAKEHLDALGQHIPTDIDAFKGAGEESGPRKPEVSEFFAQLGAGTRDDPFLKYQVNVIQDNSQRKSCPIVFEDVPSYANLIGTVEMQFQRGGAVRTSFMNIKPGALLRADGGFLVVNAVDVLLHPGAWHALKRVLKTGRLEIAVPESPLLPGLTAMKPEPIELDAKVILIGEPHLYDLLWNYEEDFRKIFKVKADFDSEMALDPKTVAHFASVVQRVVRDEKLRPLEKDGILAIVEEGVRRAGRQNKITTRFSEIADLAREADYWAGREGASKVTASHVRRAVQERLDRHRLIEEKIRELIGAGILRIEVAGSAVGQVNGLAVFDLGTYAFGQPSRITASVSPGRAGLINIERESGLSGRIHDKGVLIIAGLLRERYARDFPLSLSAGVAFEQSYSGIDGDSASSTEVYALLSALSDVPIRQSIAVTGSVDQKGHVQAIGGVNEKIEGFFTVCSVRGLNGDQGVLIPRANAGDLMLREEIVKAVAEGRFHIWAVDTIDEGVEILTATPAAEIHARVAKRLREFAETLARFERP